MLPPLWLVIYLLSANDRSTRTLAKQLRFNHRVSFKTHHEKSAVIMMGIVIGVFVVCYGIYLRCSLVVLSDTNASCKDEQYKIPVLVLNSAINPLSYAFFKRDIKKEFKRLISLVVFKKSNQVEPSAYTLDHFWRTEILILVGRTAFDGGLCQASRAAVLEPAIPWRFV